MKRKTFKEEIQSKTKNKKHQQFRRYNQNFEVKKIAIEQFQKNILLNFFQNFQKKVVQITYGKLVMECLVKFYNQLLLKSNVYFFGGGSKQTTSSSKKAFGFKFFGKIFSSIRFPSSFFLIKLMILTLI